MNEGSNTKQLTISNAFFNRIAAESAHMFNKVCFDVRKLKKPEKAYSMYAIPKDEHIMAFCKGTYLFMPAHMDGVIFTDKAVHFYATLEKDTSSKVRSIPYTLFGRYVFAQEGKKGKVIAYSENSDIQIYSLTLIAQNIAGTEILSILTAVQEELCRIDVVAREERNTLVKNLLQQAGDQLNTGDVSKRSNTILNQLLRHKSFADDAALVKAELLFRKGEIEEYKEFLDSISQNISSDLYNKLKGIPPEFVRRYVDILTDWNSTYSANNITDAYKRLKSIDDIPRPYSIIRAYLSVRMCDFNATKYFIAGVRKTFGNTEANRIEWFKGMYGNHLLLQVHEAIKSHGELPDNCVDLRDGLGLTPLHYALILKNENAISTLLKKGTWFHASPCPENNHISQFDYIVLTCGKQIASKEEVIKSVHQEVSISVGKVQALERRIIETKIKLKVQETNLSIGRYKLSAMMEAQEEHEKIIEVAERLEDLLSYIDESRMQIEQLSDILKEEESVLVQVMEDACAAALEKLGEMGESKDPFTRYMYRVYFEPDFFERVLTAMRRNDCLRLYKYNSYYFIAPQFAEIDLPYVDADNEETEDYQDTEESRESATPPPYGASWFSADAHRNISTLKSEYRQLVRMFHPDVSKHPDSNRLFQIISAEYNTILDSLN